MTGTDLLVAAVVVDSAVTLGVGVMLKRSATKAVAAAAALMWRALCNQAQPLAAPFGIVLDPDVLTAAQPPPAAPQGPPGADGDDHRRGAVYEPQAASVD